MPDPFIDSLILETTAFPRVSMVYLCMADQHLQIDESVIECAQASDTSLELRALHALQALTKSKSGSDYLQNAFREAGGIPVLLSILRQKLPNQELPQEEEAEAHKRALESLFFLTRNNPESRYKIPSLPAVIKIPVPFPS